MPVTLRPARQKDWPSVRSLLDEAGLPVEDLGAESMDAFLVAVGPAGVTGSVGLELLGTHALLRSLAVKPGSAGAGIGRALLDAIEARAATERIEEIWLLTVDAEGYFLRQGYRLRDRADVPDAVRKAPEFASLCPDSAVLMSRRLPAA